MPIWRKKVEDMNLVSSKMWVKAVVSVTRMRRSVVKIFWESGKQWSESEEWETAESAVGRGREKTEGFA